jgi:hypothetical protein
MAFVLAEVLLHLADDVDGVRRLGVRLDVDRVVDLRKVALFELDVHDGSDDLDDPANLVLGCNCHVCGPR